jgi:hypothetical protein
MLQATSKPCTPALAAGIVLYLAGFGAALSAWMAAHGSGWHAADAVVNAAPTLLAAGLALAGPARWRELLAIGLLAPLLQLLWLQTAALALAPVVTALHALLALAVHAAAVTVVMERMGQSLLAVFGGRPAVQRWLAMAVTA